MSDYVWTPEKISRFWDLVADEPRLHHMYFSKMHGANLVSFGRCAGMKGGNVLDYGCGPGYLSQQLIQESFETTALEFSPGSVERVNERLAGNKNWLGCVHATSTPSPLESNTYDWIFSIETFEHLREEWIEGYFSDLHRLLAPQGKLILSTPNEEFMDSSLIICPCCEEKFHRWGHLRASDASSLAGLASKFGFRVEFCRGIDLFSLEYPPRLPFIPRVIRKLIRYISNDFWNKLPPWNLEEIPDGGHLILVASKKKSS